MDRILILGMGGHAKSITDAIERAGVYEIAGYVVNNIEKPEYNLRYPILGGDIDLQKLFFQGIHQAAVGIGFLGKSGLRENLYNELKRIGYNLPVICDPSATISTETFVDEGTFIGKGAILNTDAHIGKLCIINTGAIVEHDCFVDNFSHVSVGTILCGGVTVGKRAFIGANATIIQGRRIADGCIIGAGEVIRKNI